MSNDPSASVLLERDGPIAWITLNRPEAMNAINEAVRSGLPARLIAAEEDPLVRVIIIQGAGSRAFCAGADIKEFGTEASPVELRRQRRDGHWSRVFDRLGKPLIAAIHGHCLGGGLELAMACDIRIASENAQLALPEVSRGTMPGAGGTQRLARLVGLGLALDMVLTGRRLSAEEAFHAGLITRVSPPDRFRADVRALAETVAGHAPVALAYAKEATTRGLDLPFSDGCRLELDLATLLLTTEDRKEAGSAFREKRKPVFKGR